MKKILFFVIFIQITVFSLNASLIEETEQKEFDLLLDNEYKSFYIDVDIDKNRIYLNAILDGEKIFLKEYKVSTVKKGLQGPKGEGKIYKIDLNPFWYPTEDTIKAFEKRGINLPKVVPPGDKNNYMGTFKIHLSHDIGKGQVYRIHGTVSPETIGKRETGGCVRMPNDIGKDFAIFIKKEMEIGKTFVVNFY